MVNIDKIQEALTPVFEKHSVILIDMVVRGERGSKVLEIFVDNYSGITTDLCAEISRDVAFVLDNENLINGNYTLNISSPGLNRPLKFPVQYYKHIGYLIEVNMMEGDQMKKITGELKAVDSDAITISDETKNDHQIKFNDIIKAIIKTPW
ncbi:MAG: hypothetical protein IGBAC_0909 [Ignavibacteriae bacterium]|nr:MAG: hypothetical protein IGBAC_0909 [Ignavibacteriota bacterium]